MIWLVVWSGGYEAPQYEMFKNKPVALQIARAWAEECEEGVDTVDVLEINTLNATVRRLEWKEVEA